MEFNCTRCGLCCARIGQLVERAKKDSSGDPGIKQFAGFPYKYDETGRCEKLNADNSCSIYATRPDMCSVDRTHEKYFSDIEQKVFYEMNYAGCKKLQQTN